MVKTGLRVYRNNIWHFFTILGFIALGLIIALSIIIPNMSNAITKSANDIKSALETPGKLDVEKFCNSIYDQLRVMDWTNPFTTLQKILTQNNLVDILTKACLAGGLDTAEVAKIIPTLNNIATSVINTSITQVEVLIWSMALCSFIGYGLIKTVIHFKSTKNYNIIKYIINLITSIAFIGFIVFLFVVTVRSTKGVGLWFSLFAITILQVSGELTISFLTYHKDGVKFVDIVNTKTIIGSIIANLVIVLISFAIVAIIYPFNQLASIMIAVPLLLVTSIIMNTVTNTFVTNYNKKSIKYSKGV